VLLKSAYFLLWRFCAFLSKGRGGGKEGGGRCPDAVAAVALAAAAPAESALEFAREAHTAGPFEHTPACFYDLDDPNFGCDDQTCLGDGERLGRLRLRQRKLGSGCMVVPGPDVSGDTGLGDTRSVFWVADCLYRGDSESPSPPKKKGGKACYLDHRGIKGPGTPGGGVKLAVCSAGSEGIR
jgi:hypothetical protein